MNRKRLFCTITVLLLPTDNRSALERLADIESKTFLSAYIRINPRESAHVFKLQLQTCCEEVICSVTHEETRLFRMSYAGGISEPLRINTCADLRGSKRICADKSFCNPVYKRLADMESKTFLSAYIRINPRESAHVFKLQLQTCCEEVICSVTHEETRLFRMSYAGGISEPLRINTCADLRGSKRICADKSFCNPVYKRLADMESKTFLSAYIRINPRESAHVFIRVRLSPRTSGQGNQRRGIPASVAWHTASTLSVSIPCIVPSLDWIAVHPC